MSDVWLSNETVRVHIVNYIPLVPRATGSTRSLAKWQFIPMPVRYLDITICNWYLSVLTSIPLNRSDFIYKRVQDAVRPALFRNLTSLAQPRQLSLRFVRSSPRRRTIVVRRLFLLRKRTAEHSVFNTLKHENQSEPLETSLLIGSAYQRPFLHRGVTFSRTAHSNASISHETRTSDPFDRIF